MGIKKPNVSSEGLKRRFTSLHAVSSKSSVAQTVSHNVWRHGEWLAKPTTSQLTSNML